MYDAGRCCVSSAVLGAALPIPSLLLARCPLMFFFGYHNTTIMPMVTLMVLITMVMIRSYRRPDLVQHVGVPPPRSLPPMDVIYLSFAPSCSSESCSSAIVRFWFPWPLTTCLPPFSSITIPPAHLFYSLIFAEGEFLSSHAATFSFRFSSRAPRQHTLACIWFTHW